MCGIAGYFDPSGSPLPGMDALQQMTRRIAHRGPDDEHYYVNGCAGLGFRRLALLDRQSGRQPVLSEDGSVASICNGEILNYRALRRELEEKGHVFHGYCDAEVLPHLYEEFGVGLLEKLSGQFAFAIYDARARKLFLARDHFGICPLFYTKVGSAVVFASEVKALLAYPGVECRLDMTGFDQVLSFPGLVSPSTMFKGIISLASGHYVIATGDGVREAEYWDLDYPVLNELPAAETEDRYAEELTGLLAESVRERLVSDTPVGLYLSGGLDSSLVAALAHQEERNCVRQTFSVSFQGKANCEREHQQAVVRATGAVHRDVEFDSGSVLDRLKDAVYHAECPLRETYDTACLALAESAKASGCSVVLTGQGADELFAGYIGYRYDQFRAQGRAAAHGNGQEKLLNEKLWGDSTIGYDDYGAIARLKQQLYSQELLSQLPQFDCFERSPVNQAKLRNRHRIHQRSYLDLKLRLADHLLGDHGDRMSMAHAVEARHAFLDLKIVNFVRRLPVEMKLNGWCEKFILKRVAAGLVPECIVEREKFAWFAPGSPDLLKAGRPWVEELLEDGRIRRQGIFNPEFVRALKSQYSSNSFKLQHPIEMDLMAVLLTFQIFMEIFQPAR